MTPPELSSTSSTSSFSASSTMTEIDHRFICPLTGLLMDDPVMSVHGQNFERQAILNHLLKLGNKTCPITGEPLGPRNLLSNKSLRQEINGWKFANGMMDKISDANTEPSSSLGCHGDDNNYRNESDEDVVIRLKSLGLAATKDAVTVEFIMPQQGGDGDKQKAKKSSSSKKTSKDRKRKNQKYEKLSSSSKQLSHAAFAA